MSDKSTEAASQDDIKGVLAKFCLSILELRDVSTYKHSLNVLNVARRIMDALPINDHFREIVELGCILHDIGKITVSCSLLRKKGPFNNEEYDKIKGHPLAGHKMIQQIERYMPAEVLEIILSHHEKNGGAGYPRNRSNLPIYVEIVAVADIAAAMQEHRHHRLGWPLDICVQELRKYQWSQDLVELIANRPNLLELGEDDKAVIN